MGVEASDEALVAAALGGDDPAFDVLVRRHFARLYSVAFRMLGNHEDAEDLAQDAFVRAHAALAHWRGEGPLVGWLVRIAVHLARSRHRRAARRPEPRRLTADAEHRAHPTTEPDRTLSRRELSATVAEAVQNLPPDLRAALVLRVLEELDYGEVAEITGVRPGTVRTRVMRARRLLLRWLGPWFERSPRE